MLIGHQKIWQFLKKSLEIDRLPHAYLFYGQEKLGKKTLAMEFVKWLFNEDIQKKQHPDFIFIKPEKNEIQISQIRDLIWKLSLKSFSASFKVAIIDKSHLMNSEAQNCFLKTLEEPKGKTLLILITEYPELLFPTILSRVQKIKFYPVKKTEIEDYLISQGISQNKAKELALLSLGKPGEALDFLSDSQKLENQQKLIQDLINVSNSDLAFRFQYAKNLSKELNLREILNIWLFYFRDILISAINYQQGNIFNDREKNFQFFHGYSLNKLKNILKQIQSINFLISSTNVNPRLALEILMIEL